MKYKNTYFEVSLNHEISVSKQEYGLILNNEKRVKDIEELEAKITEVFKKRGLDYLIIDTDSSDLEAILDSKEFDKDLKEKCAHSEYSSIKKWLRSIIYDKTISPDLNSKRYTKEHEQALNNHLNENAKDGWKLLTMTPVIKGLYDSHYSSYGHSYYGFGYGHDVLEGFVMIWEKME